MLKLFERYPTTIWIRIMGTVLSKICDFMVRSFAGIYLYEKMGQDILTSASVTIAGPAAAFLISSIAGGWSDRLGRKPVMVSAILIQALSVAGYLFARDFSHFFLLSLFTGLGTALFWPAAQAQIADLIPDKQRGEVFALMHVAINVGAALGPMIGVLMYRKSPEIAFMASSLGLVAFALLLLFATEESAPKKLNKNSVDTAALAVKTSFWEFISIHKTIFYIMLASIPVGILYSQVELVLPLQLKSKFTDYLSIFGLLMTINGTCVALLQLPLQKWVQRFDLAKAIGCAYLLMMITALGYGWFAMVPLLIIAELFFTFGEMTVGPQIQKLVAQIAPPELRGRYFSIHALHWGIAGMTGPLLGALGTKYIGGNMWFTVLAVAIGVAGFAQWRITRKALHRNS